MSWAGCRPRKVRGFNYHPQEPQLVAPETSLDARPMKKQETAGDHWPTETVAAVIGVDAKRLRRAVMQGEFDGTRDGRLMTQQGLDDLFESMDMDFKDVDPVEAFDRWETYVASIDRQPAPQSTASRAVQPPEGTSARASASADMTGTSIDNLAQKIEKLNGLLEKLLELAEKAGQR